MCSFGVRDARDLQKTSLRHVFSNSLDHVHEHPTVLSASIDILSENAEEATQYSVLIPKSRTLSHAQSYLQPQQALRTHC